MTKLSFNINKIATLRNARGENLPDLLNSAIDIINFGADCITIHPRPDGRHIKYSDAIDLGNGQVLGTFVIKKELKNIINSEDKTSPFNDDTLVQFLNDKGYKLARRTVAKYRDQLGLPVARLRKEI